MNAIVGRLFNWMDQNGVQGSISTDPTVYRVETVTHTYCGQILFQDDFKIKVKIEGPRIVKILKQNIQRVVIVKSELNSRKSITSI